MDAALVREIADVTARPGQPQGSLAVERVPTVALLTTSRPAGANRYDWAGEAEVRSALYRRGRYGAARYLSAS